MTASTVPSLSSKRERVAWYLAVFSTYFKNVVVGGAEGSRLWGLAIGIALVIVALIAPVLGAMADFSGAKKRFLLGFTAQAITFTGLLFFVQSGDVVAGMLFFILAEIGYRSSQVFYDGFLPELARQEEMGRVSGNGWAIGSAGGVIALLIVLPVVLLMPGEFSARLAIWLFLNQTQIGFLLIGAAAGIAMAGVQSVSRTMVGLFAPPGRKRRVLRLLHHGRPHRLLGGAGDLRLGGSRAGVDV